MTRRVFFTEIESNHSYSKHKLDTEFDKDSETSVFESDNAVTGLDESSGKSESSYSSSTDSKEERRRKRNNKRKANEDEASKVQFLIRVFRFMHEFRFRFQGLKPTKKVLQQEASLVPLVQTATHITNIEI